MQVLGEPAFPVARHPHGLGLRVLDAGTLMSPIRVGLEVLGLGSQTPVCSQAPLSSRDLSWKLGAGLCGSPRGRQALRRC